MLTFWPEIWHARTGPIASVDACAAALVAAKPAVATVNAITTRRKGILPLVRTPCGESSVHVHGRRAATSDRGSGRRAGGPGRRRAGPAARVRRALPDPARRVRGRGARAPGRGAPPRRPGRAADRRP